MRWVRVVLVGLASGVLLLVGSLIVRMVLKGDIGRPVRYELPPGYRGWAAVRYEDPACPPLRTKGIWLVIPVGAGGRGCTSSPPPRGWRYTRFEYVAPDGKRTALRITHRGGGGEAWPYDYVLNTKLETIFIGTEEEWGTAPRAPSE
jgi:hypothetical protein